MRYAIRHTTAYNYSEPASLSQNELFLTPRTCPSQRVVEHSLAIQPTTQYRHRRTDYYGNTVDVFMIQHPHKELAVTSNSIVETTSQAKPAGESTPSWESVTWRLTRNWQPDDFEALPFLFPSPLVSISSEVADYAGRSFAPGTPVLTGALDLMRRIYTEFSYDKTASTVDTTVDQVLVSRKGVCQDFAHLAISCLRSLGLAARYVSGYLETIPAPGKPRMAGSDASHAWVSIFIPDHGWVDFDPTNNLLVDQTHITLAWGRDYGDVAPVKGVVMGGGSHRLIVKVDVVPSQR